MLAAEDNAVGLVVVTTASTLVPREKHQELACDNSTPLEGYNRTQPCVGKNAREQYGDNAFLKLQL